MLFIVSILHTDLKLELLGKPCRLRTPRQNINNIPFLEFLRINILLGDAIPKNVIILNIYITFLCDYLGTIKNYSDRKVLFYFCMFIVGSGLTNLGHNHSLSNLVSRLKVVPRIFFQMSSSCSDITSDSNHHILTEGKSIVSFFSVPHATFFFFFAQEKHRLYLMTRIQYFTTMSKSLIVIYHLWPSICLSRRERKRRQNAQTANAGLTLAS